MFFCFIRHLIVHDKYGCLILVEWGDSSNLRNVLHHWDHSRWFHDPLLDNKKLVVFQKGRKQFLTLFFQSGTAATPNLPAVSEGRFLPNHITSANCWQKTDLSNLGKKLEEKKICVPFSYSFLECRNNVDSGPMIFSKRRQWDSN